MSEAHSLRMVLTGPGGHGAMPMGKGDVIKATAHLVAQLGTVTEGLSYEGADCVCSAGTLSAGTAVNVVPTRATVTGTLRTFTDGQREDALGRLRALCAGLRDSHGVEVELTVPEQTPAVVNDSAVTDVVEAAARTVVDRDHVIRMPPAAPSDDVSEFLNHLPGSYFFVGGAAHDGSSGMHHSPKFSVEDGSLRVGAGVVARSAVELATP
jgi:metal-dependent amidase/aminoacylase/carboxypeptidase family protein